MKRNRKEERTRICTELLETARETHVPAHCFELHLKALKEQQIFDPNVLSSDGLNVLGVAIAAKNVKAMRSIFNEGQK